MRIQSKDTNFAALKLWIIHRKDERKHNKDSAAAIVVCSCSSINWVIGDYDTGFWWRHLGRGKSDCSVDSIGSMLFDSDIPVWYAMEDNRNGDCQQHRWRSAGIADTPVYRRIIGQLDG
jgi:hypothetical protein